MNIKHWEQYLTPLGKTKLNLKPDTFENLFKWQSIILPVFQRKYCWTIKQLERYWHDLLYVSLNITNLGHREHRRRHDNAHSLGKIVTFEEPEINRIIVIDGQQRLTTTLIILISIYHHLKKLKKLNKKENKKDGNNNNDEITPKFDNNDIIKKIKNILFIKKISNNDILYDEGDTLEDYIRFLPTYLDRSYFYDVLFNKMDRKRNHNLYFAKKYFDEQLIEYNDYKQMKSIYHHLLTQFKFVYVGIPKIEKDINNSCHCIYQWFFERELYVEKCGGDRPGYTQTVCDLFRNYVLSFFISETLDKQKQIYKLWIEVEKSYENVLILNKYLITLIDTKIESNAKSYDLYRAFVKMIEKKLTKYQKDEYKVFIETFLSNLKCKNPITYIEHIGGIENNQLLIYGYIRCIDNVSAMNYILNSLSKQIIDNILMFLFINDDDDNDNNDNDDNKNKPIKQLNIINDGTENNYLDDTLIIFDDKGKLLNENKAFVSLEEDNENFSTDDENN